MYPATRFLVDLLGLTEEQIAKLRAYQSIEVTADQLFMNDDPTVIRIGPRDLDRMCLNIPPRVMRALIAVLREVYRTMDAETIEPTRTTPEELERAVGDAAGEGMGTARSSSQTPSAPPSAPPSTRPWTPGDKIPN